MYQNYIITKEGSIISKYTGKQVYVHTNKKGYLFVRLYINGRTNTRLVHRLVAEVHIPNPEGKPQVNHKDANKSNNNDWNLEWVTPQENVAHAVANGLVPRGSDKVNSKFTDDQVREVRALRELGHTYFDLAGRYGCSYQTIGKICNEQTYSHVN